ncbi:hypothetical protein MHYP_G00025110 [Metynnis hypsauchen]
MVSLNESHRGVKEQWMLNRGLGSESRKKSTGAIGVNSLAVDVSCPLYQRPKGVLGSSLPLSVFDRLEDLLRAYSHPPHLCALIACFTVPLSKRD